MAKNENKVTGVIDSERRNKIKDFVERWKKNIAESGKANDEKQNTQRFWLDLLESLFGLSVGDEYIKFEDRVELKHTSYIDGYIPKTKVLIEQKSSNVDLSKAYKQSDGEELTPYEQAKRYNSELTESENAKWIIVCNFKEFHVYDMNKKGKVRDVPVILPLENLEKESHVLNILVDKFQKDIIRETEISVKAGQLVGKLYDALSEQYEKPMSDEDYKSLNRLCVQLVFCLYAEDSGLFGEKLAFHDYLQKLRVIGADYVRDGIKRLFDVLNMENRPSDLNKDLEVFPYVNGGLFKSEGEKIPSFNDKIVEILLDKASAGFDWSEISPTIFGAVFESTLNSETRRKGGMHYTSIENIHKVIDPLFMDGLKKEFNSIKKMNKTEKSKKFLEFQEKLASLTFFDPACGSGNFLTETYLSLRRLENDIIKELYSDDIKKGQTLLDTDLMKVSVGQFYGIEINDFAVSVAKTALWIAESQMLIETARIIGKKLARFPLKDYENIKEGNALKIDWESVVEKEKLCYIMGNPPFVGYSLQSKEQKEDVLSLYVDENGKSYSTAGKIDYVSCWYIKAADFMQGTNIRAALVSTNSITQGEQVASVWKPLYDRFGIHIDFAHRTFKWESDSQGKAHVHCVVVGFSIAENKAKKVIFDGKEEKEVKNINPYLVDADNIFLESRNEPICDVPKMTNGNRPADGGHLIIEAKDCEDFIKKEPGAKKFIKKLVGSEEYINGKDRYCLWLVNANPAELRKMPEVMKRVEACKQDRLRGADDRKKLALTPTVFREIRQPDTDYIIVPVVSSERRRYVPMGFLDQNTIVSNTVQIIPDATLYHFGVLTSDVHMAWMRAVCGRLEMRYSYSKNIVYNNFPWPEINKEMKTAIEKTAKAILDARAAYPDSSLADLYDDISMPPPLVKAHKANDAAVRKAYGFKTNTTESEIVAKLLEMYQEKTAK